MTSSADCYSCAQETGTSALPPREFIAGDDRWRVAHALGAVVEGWLVLLPRRHVESVSGLTDAEAGSLGLWQVRLSRALHQVTGCQKTYIAQFAESEGFAHVHFHVIPRPPGLAEELRGPGIFQMALRDDQAPVTEQRQDEIARELAGCLARSTGHQENPLRLSHSNSSLAWQAAFVGRMVDLKRFTGHFSTVRDTKSGQHTK